jgi:hypothetical protein
MSEESPFGRQRCGRRPSIHGNDTISISTVTGIIARVLLHARSARYTRTFWHDPPLVPQRETLFALQWLGALFGSHVVVI